MSIEIIDEVEDKVIREWIPNARQADFIKIPFTVFEALYGGAVGGGKSDILVMLPIVYRFYQHPLFHGILFRRTFPQLEESLIMRARDKWYRPLINAGLCEYNESKHYFKFKSGARLRFGFMEQDQDARAHDTAQYHYVGIDEASQFTEFQLRFISSRIRTETKDLPAIYRLCSNPGGIGHVYLRDRFIKPAPNGYTILKQNLPNGKSLKRIFIPAKLTDNPHIMNEDPDYINRLQMLPEGEREAKISGDWFAFSGQVFTEFRDIRRAGEPDNAMHIIDVLKSPISIPDWWPKIASIDWGFRAKTVAHVAAISPDDRLIVFYERVWKGALVSTWASDFARDMQYVQNLKQPIELDPSAWQKRGDEKTIEEHFRTHSGMSCRKADNDRIQGKILVHEYLRFEPRPSKYIPQEGFTQAKADQILRLYGLDAYEQYRALFEPEKPETNLPKLQIFSTCTDLIETIKQCQYGEAKKDGLVVEDVKEFNGDDSYDNLRYLLKGTRRYFEECKQENERRRQMGEVLERTLKSNDWNSYAINIQRINRESSGPSGVIRKRRFNAFH